MAPTIQYTHPRDLLGLARVPQSRCQARRIWQDTIHGMFKVLTSRAIEASAVLSAVPPAARRHQEGLPVLRRRLLLGVHADLLHPALYQQAPAHATCSVTSALATPLMEGVTYTMHVCHR